MKKNQSSDMVGEQHRRLVEAIISGDAAEAEKCMSEHMDTVEEYMEELQNRQTDGEHIPAGTEE